jgi:coenzyme F420-reducing hydrogenase alpha subunit
MVRHLMHYSEQLQSHVLHVGYLVAPDLFAEKSVVPLVPKATDAVLKIIKCHRVANQMSALIAGRITHPITLTPGGMTKVPTVEELTDLKAALADCVPDLVDICKVVLSVAENLPAFERDTEYVSLKQTHTRSTTATLPVPTATVTATCPSTNGKALPTNMSRRSPPLSGLNGTVSRTSPERSLATKIRPSS